MKKLASLQVARSENMLSNDLFDLSYMCHNKRMLWIESKGFSFIKVFIKLNPENVYWAFEGMEFKNNNSTYTV